MTNQTITTIPGAVAALRELRGIFELNRADPPSAHRLVCDHLDHVLEFLNKFPTDTRWDDQPDLKSAYEDGLAVLTESFDKFIDHLQRPNAR